LTLAGSAISNLHRPAGASIIDLSPLDGDFAAAAVAQLDLAEMTDDAVILRPAPWAKPVWVLLDYVPHWQPHHLSPFWYLASTLCAPLTQTAPSYEFGGEYRAPMRIPDALGGPQTRAR
jgi:hypothetical protein